MKCGSSKSFAAFADGLQRTNRDGLRHAFGAFKGSSSNRVVGQMVGQTNCGSNLSLFYKCLEVETGGAKGDRTPDLIIANDTLSQLSYCPIRVACFAEVRAIVKLSRARA